MKSLACRLFLLRFVACTTLVAVQLGTTVFVSAADRTWINGSGRLFTDAANWDTGVPGAADKAIFDGAGAGTFQVDFTNNTFNIADLEVGNELVRFDFNGGTLELSGFSTQVGTVGSTGFLFIEDGTLITQIMRVGSPTPGGAAGLVELTEASVLVARLSLLLGQGDSDSVINLFEGSSLNVGFGDPLSGDLFLGLNGNSGDLLVNGVGTSANIAGDINIFDLSDLTLDQSSLVTVVENVNVFFRRPGPYQRREFSARYRWRSESQHWR
jgi:hypothetical protein